MRWVAASTWATCWRRRARETGACELEPAYIDKVAGTFTTVRLPVRWSNHAAPTADATLDEAFAARVDRAVDALLAKGMYVILDMHHYSQLSGDKLHPNEFAVDPAVMETRLVNMWRQIALRYKDRSPKLLFELLNEPHGRLDGEAWNALAAQRPGGSAGEQPDAHRADRAGLLEQRRASCPGCACRPTAT